MHEGLSREQARRQMFVMDVGGLVVEGVSAQGYQLPVSQDPATYADWSISGEVPGLLEVIEQARPTVLLGLTGVSWLFQRATGQADGGERRATDHLPAVQSDLELRGDPQDLIAWTNGKAIIASGSPLPTPSTRVRALSVRATTPSCFPGIGFAAILGRCRRISDAMIIESAFALADYTERHYLSSRTHLSADQRPAEVSVEVATGSWRWHCATARRRRTDLDSDDLARWVTT